VNLIQLQTLIAAPPERCFDLSLSVDIHLASTAKTGERVVSGPTAGLLGPGDTITWEARHFGLRRRLTVKITAYVRPRMFATKCSAAHSVALRHDHWFEPHEHGTRLRDEFEFASALAPLDALVLKPHLRRLLLTRNDTIRWVAEGTDWRRYLT